MRNEGKPQIARDDRFDGAREILAIQQTPLDEFAHESIEAMQANVVDASPESHVAETLAGIMTEFAADGEAFQPSQNPELREFLMDALSRTCPEASMSQIATVLEEVQDFPPKDAHNRFDLAA